MIGCRANHTAADFQVKARIFLKAAGLISTTKMEERVKFGTHLHEFPVFILIDFCVVSPF
jgi:hypothetical protein